MWQSNANKGKRGQLPALGRSATTKGIRHPPRCAVRKTRGQEYPHTAEQRKEERKTSEQQFSPPHTFPVPSWFPTLSTHPSLRHEQLLRPSHQPSSSQPQTAQENEQTASPTWDWLTTPGHHPVFSFLCFQPRRHQLGVPAVQKDMRPSHFDRVLAEPALVVGPLADPV